MEMAGDVIVGQRHENGGVSDFNEGVTKVRGKADDFLLFSLRPVGIDVIQQHNRNFFRRNVNRHRHPPCFLSQIIRFILSARQDRRRPGPPGSRGFEKHFTDSGTFFLIYIFFRQSQAGFAFCTKKSARSRGRRSANDSSAGNGRFPSSGRNRAKTD